jgi:hypothetical protein
MAPPAMLNDAILAVELALAPAIYNQSTITAVEPTHAPAIPAIGPTTLHPIQPLPRMLPHPKSTFKPNQHALKRDRTRPQVLYCWKPERQFIQNAVVPSILPRGITEYKYKLNPNNRNSFFAVRYDNYHIRYTYKANGYTRKNAYMEVARCLRYLLIQTILKLDDTMEITHDMYDTLDDLLIEMMTDNHHYKEHYH